MTVDLKRLARLRKAVPHVLWKYCGPMALPMLQTMQLKVTRPNEFNDPFEFAPGIFGKVSPQALAKLYEDPAWVEKWDPPALSANSAERTEELAYGASMIAEAARGIMSEELDRISGTHAVICLAGNADSILMWSHYAQNHCGFAVGIDHTKLGDLPIFPVEYIGRRVLFRPLTIMGRKPDVRAFDIFTRKSDVWAYEKEYRSIWPLKELIPGSIGSAPAYFLPLLPEAIAEVRLGCRATAELEESIRSVLRDAGSPARIMRARLHPRQYRLVFEAESKEPKSGSDP